MFQLVEPPAGGLAVFWRGSSILEPARTLAEQGLQRSSRGPQLVLVAPVRILVVLVVFEVVLVGF